MGAPEFSLLRTIAQAPVPASPTLGSVAVTRVTAAWLAGVLARVDAPDLAGALRAAAPQDEVVLLARALPLPQRGQADVVAVAIGTDVFALDAGTQTVVRSALTGMAESAAAAAPPRGSISMPPTVDLSTPARLFAAAVGSAGAAPGGGSSPVLDAGLLFDNAPGADPAPPEQAAARLQAALEFSGLFFESHVAQWSRGQRSIEALRRELLRLSGSGQTADTDPTLSGARVAAQIDALQRRDVQIDAEAWPGQPVTINLGVGRALAETVSGAATGRRTPEAGDDPVDSTVGPDTVAAVQVARMRLDLPALGVVDVVLRLSGQAVTVAVESRDPRPLQEHLPACAALLQARGLVPVALSASSPKDRRR